MRPYPSATAPANPRAHSRAQQGNGDDEPVTKELVSKSLLDGVDGAVDDGVSKPKRKPPMAATIARKRTRPECPRSTVDPSP